MFPHPEVPSILVGLGAFGTQVVERVLAERSNAIDAIDDEPPLASILIPRRAQPAALAEQVVTEARRLLSHPRMVRMRDRRRADGLTRLHVFVVASLSEPDVRAGLGEALAVTERRLLAELGPIFEAFRTGAERNLVVLPIVAMPHPAASPDGAELILAVRALSRRLAATPARQRATPQLFLIEDVAEFSVLGDAELAQCVRNFLTLLVYSISAVPRVNQLLYGETPSEPIATFVCAVSELPRRALATYAVDSVALEVVDAVLERVGEDVDLREIDALEEVELAAFDEPRDADRDVLELLGRYAPPIDKDEEPRWWERAETIRERYGPDPNDPSLVEAQPPPDPPVGWALARMRGIEKTWRMLQRRRFDDAISQERERIARERDAVLSGMRARVDATLWSDPAPDAFRRASVLVSRMERAVSLRLEDAVRDRDAALPVPPPSFTAFRDAHGHFMDEARRLPDLARMALYGALFVAAAVLFAPLSLRALADALSIAPTDWQSPWLRERAWLTALVFSTSGVSLFAFFRYRRAYLAMRRAFHEMYDALENTVTGLRDSLLEYFASRLRLAREVARVEALLAVRSAILGDAERLTLLDRAARRARTRLLESLRSVGVERGAAGRLDPSGLFGQGDEALIESLLPPESGAHLERVLPPEARDARVRDVLFTLARDQRYRHLWREEVPFTSLPALREAAAPHAAPAAEWDPFESPESAEATVRALAAFARRQARSLHVALNVSGHEMQRAGRLTSAIAGELIAPPRAFEDARRLLAEEGAGGRATIPVHRGLDPDRAFYVLAVGDIADDAVTSLSLPDDPVDLAFEVEL